jgi:hypothetical protein
MAYLRPYFEHGQYSWKMVVIGCQATRQDGFPELSDDRPSLWPTIRRIEWVHPAQVAPLDHREVSVPAVHKMAYTDNSTARSVAGDFATIILG